MFVGANIKKRRYALRMSQQELADAMGYKTRSTIAKIESGENDVSQKKLQKFAAVLDTTVEALILGCEPSTVPLPAPGLTAGNRGRVTAIILAGGKTNQNRQNIPNQFVNVHGKPILVYSLEAYQAHPAIGDIYVVCLKGWENIVSAYAEEYGITKLRGLICGGSTGVLSLKNAWETVKERCGPEDIVVIQEATRPMVTQEMISNLLRVCQEKGSAVTCHSMSDYVQFHVENGKTRYADRNSLVALQSPEAHRLEILTQVFQQAGEKKHPLTASCCTMLMYELGMEIHFVESSVNNIKIAREEDAAAFSTLVTG